MEASKDSKRFSNEDEDLQRSVLGQQQKYALYREAIKQMFGGGVSKIGELDSDMENKLSSQNGRFILGRWER